MSKWIFDKKYGVHSVPDDVNNEYLAWEYIKASGKKTHASDCATSCAPAEVPGPCDCDCVDQPAEAHLWFSNSEPLEMKMMQGIQRADNAPAKQSEADRIAEITRNMCK